MPSNSTTMAGLSQGDTLCMYTTVKGNIRGCKQSLDIVAFVFEETYRTRMPASLTQYKGICPYHFSDPEHVWLKTLILKTRLCCIPT